MVAAECKLSSKTGQTGTYLVLSTWVSPGVVFVLSLSRELDCPTVKSNLKKFRKQALYSNRRKLRYHYIDH